MAKGLYMDGVVVTLHPGCKLILKGGVDGIEGRKAEFVGHEEMQVGYFDHNGPGLPMGRYHDRRFITVMTERGEQKHVTWDDVSLEDTDPVRATIEPGFSTPERIGDLYDPPRFTLGDIVTFGTEYTHRYVLMRTVLSHDKPTKYQFKSLDKDFAVTSLAESHGAHVVERGNIWKLYHPEDGDLVFASDEEEIKFWIHPCASELRIGRDKSPGTLHDCAPSFAEGRCDLVFQVGDGQISPIWPKNPLLCTFRLHETFSRFRPRVRALTERLYGSMIRAAL